MHRLGRACLVALGCAAVLAGCAVGPSHRPPLVTSGAPDQVTVTPPGTSTMPIGPGGPGRPADPVSWSDCPADITDTDPAAGRRFLIRCAQVQVPKSYTGAAPGSLSISVAKAAATDTPPAAPPLVVVLDGPGRGGTHQVAAVAAALPADILAHFSLVVMDVRGTGDSAPIDCISGQNSAGLLSLGADPTTPTTAARLAELSRSLTFDCGDLVGPGLSDYSTVSAADDLDTVRAALGVATIDFIGRGFGATLGAVYADRYPGRIGAVVLDGPADPSSTPATRAVAGAAADQQALSWFASACQSFSGGCPLGVDPVGAVAGLIRTLGDVGRPSSGRQQITGGSIVRVLTEQLGRPAGWPALAAALQSARTGDTDAVAALLVAALGADVEQQQSGRLVYQCNDSGQRLAGAALTTAVSAARAGSPLFGPFLVGLVALCSTWPAPENGLAAVTAAGAPPVLVIGAVDDPVAPYTAVRSLTAQMDSATLLTWQSGTHGGYPTSSCVTAAVRAYLLQHTVPPIGTLCPP